MLVLGGGDLHPRRLRTNHLATRKPTAILVGTSVRAPTSGPAPGCGCSRRAQVRHAPVRKGRCRPPTAGQPVVERRMGRRAGSPPRSASASHDGACRTIDDDSRLPPIRRRSGSNTVESDVAQCGPNTPLLTRMIQDPPIVAQTLLHFVRTGQAGRAQRPVPRVRRRRRRGA